MNLIISRDSDNLKMQAERIKQDLAKLEQDCSAWYRKREQKDLRDLMEDLKGVERDLSVMLTDCISSGRQYGEGIPNALLHDLHEIFACLDTLFNGLKRARLQLGKTYIPHAILNHLEIDYGRFSKLIARVQRDLNGQGRQPAVLPEEARFHLAQDHGRTGIATIVRTN